MSKVKCSLVTVYAPESQTRYLMKRLQEMSIMDIDTVAGDAETGDCPTGFEKRDTASETAAYERNLAAAEEALRILNERVPEKKGLLASFSDLPTVPQEKFYLNREAREAARSLAGDIIADDRKIAEERAEIVRLRTTAELMRPWEELDVPLSFRGTVSTATLIGSVPGKYTLEELLAVFAERAPDLTLHAEIVYSDKDNTYLFLLCPASERAGAEELLRGLSFARPAQNTSKLPRDKIASKNARITECEARINECEKRLIEAAERREELKIFADLCRVRADGCRTLGEIGHTAHTVMIRGYVADPDIDLLKRVLEREFTVVVETQEADPALAPVKLKNNWFTSPAETITTMYSLPSDKDIDPTPITGFFYYLLFGMMFSDAGYGLLLIIGTLLGLKLLHPSPKMRQSLKMFLFCGVSTTIWGLIFGSFFGDAVAVISETFFGHRVALPALIDPMNGGAVTLLILSIVIGFVQIMAGLTAKFITCMKNGDKAGAFFDTGLWMGVLLGIGVLALGVALGGPFTTIGGIIAGLSAVGLILTQGRDKKNPVMRIFSGIASLYDITGYVSDLLSFSRLMALGLTTAAMGAVFNLLGTLGGRGVVGVIMMIIIFPVGHALCFALNVLGAYVHTLRLQYVELFSKFYEGGGREFKSFSIKNKYVGVENTQVKEEL